MMGKILVLDSNSLINRAFYALPNFSNRKGQFTGAIFGYMNMLLKLIDEYKPDYIIATFDRHAPTFRKQMYQEYKAQRKGMPDELRAQIEPMKEVLRAMDIPILEMDGYEADDIIGTIAKTYKDQTYIVTGDRDSLQLVDDSTTVLLTRKGVSEIEAFTPQYLKETWNMVPSQIVDLKSLMGDTSDNIPGVPGVGEKTAKDLLEKYQTLDGVYEHIDEIKGKLKEKLELNKELAYLSYKLATIKIDTPISFDLESAKFSGEYAPKLFDVLKDLELNKIIEKMSLSGGEKHEEIKIDIKNIVSVDGLKEVKDEIFRTKKFSLAINENIEISTNKNNAYQIQLSDNLLEGIFFDAFLYEFKDIFEDASIQKIIFDVKNFMYELKHQDIKIQNYDDILVMAYVLDANRNIKSLKDLIDTFGIVINSQSAAILHIEEQVLQLMKEKKLESLYFDIEKPLIKVLFDMEQAGFSVDRQKIEELSTKYKGELACLTQQIYDAAGMEFNINSPRQLAHVLFEELGLDSKKAKTKTGYSTNVEVLQELQDSHPIISLLLRYRELEKLRSTYLDGMLPLIDEDGKIHTIFKQTVTATGRLSSTEPNLQNIPVRKEEGRQIRGMFIASKGQTLVCADYSQIELRLMASFSQDEGMISDFNSGKDIHAATASKIFNVPLPFVDKDLRRQAKAVNFGIIYGITDFGLSQDLGIPVYKAKEFTTNYFKTYPRVHEYMEELVEKAQKCGYATTMMGRIRTIPELTMSNRNMQGFGKRVAMNMPLQGSASDIIKLAMIKVANELEKGNYKAKLIMQVHDELIIDCPLDEVEKIKPLLKNAMESVVKLEVPLIAEVGVGDNWLEAK
ncbi:MAG: DNA polymerase I [Clostridia bacterium]|nr:DNA polymerase I [Clostridia bacterium]